MINKSNEARVSLWLDKNLAQILKDRQPRDNLNKELRLFFKKYTANKKILQFR